MANDYNVNGNVNVNKGGNGTNGATSSDPRIAEREHELKLARIESTGKVEAEQARTAGKISVLEKEHELRVERDDTQMVMGMKLINLGAERIEILSRMSIEASASATKSRTELVLGLAAIDKELAMAFLVENAAIVAASAAAITSMAKAIETAVATVATVGGGAIELRLASLTANAAKAAKLS